MKISENRIRHCAKLLCALNSNGLHRFYLAHPSCKWEEEFGDSTGKTCSYINDSRISCFFQVKSQRSIRGDALKGFITNPDVSKCKSSFNVD